jgi:hypothetical protein
MNKGNMVYMHNGVLFNHKEEQNCVMCKKIYGTGDYHAKQSKLYSKDKYCMLYLICGI